MEGEEQYDPQESKRRMIDFLRYTRKYVPISEQRNRITKDIDRLRLYLHHPERLTKYRNRKKEEEHG